MSEYTKGEWTRGDIIRGQFNISINKRHFAIVKFTHLSDMEQDEANAELIASAPTLKQQRDDLLAACIEAQKVFGFIAENYKSAPHFPTAERLVDDAIAKCQK